MAPPYADDAAPRNDAYRLIENLPAPLATRTCHAQLELAQRELQPRRHKTTLLAQGTPLPLHPKMKKMTHITRNMTNKSFAIPADAAAMPPNPSTAAMSAIIRKVTAQPNIVSPPLAMNRMSQLCHACFCYDRATRGAGFLKKYS